MFFFIAWKVLEMKEIRIMMLSKRKIKRLFLITAAILLGLYLLIALYFINHYSFNTEINGVNVSLKSHNKILKIINQYTENYQLQLLERYGETESISGNSIAIHLNNNFNSKQLYVLQNPLLWFKSMFKKNSYYFNNLYLYNVPLLEKKISNLSCVNSTISEPRNVTFEYSNNTYSLIKENYGNKINHDRFIDAVKGAISKGRTTLDLHHNNCYENPKYTLESKKTYATLKLLNKYVSTKITYLFGNVTEQLNGSIIQHWLTVNDDLEVDINTKEVNHYIATLGKKYDTVGVPREFRTSTGKIIEVKGGLYGWKMNRASESQALLSHIKHGDVIEKEPDYLQKALSRDGNEIGTTYIEINITRQHVWFYKNGKLLVQGGVVTGNPSRGNATVLGVYMINYKQLDATLVGENYASKVKYWMPFFGNMGLHDAPWRNSFGGNIYLTRGSHGCVNAPIFLAKTVFENVEAGTPIIVYEED